jgi:hypothetical protein
MHRYRNWNPLLRSRFLMKNFFAFLAGLVTGAPCGAVLGLALIVAACKNDAPPLTPTDVVNLSAETIEKQECDRDFPDSGALYEACFAGVTARYNVVFGTDGGAE